MERKSKMTKGLFSSTTDLWATPQAFFDELDKEFHFDLDPCALPENAKCEKYFTPEIDGLKQNWGGTKCSATLLMARKSRIGSRNVTRKAESQTHLSLCSFLHEPTHRTFTTTSTTKPNFALFVVAYISTKHHKVHHSRLWL